jgi:hypothetical protein
VELLALNFLASGGVVLHDQARVEAGQNVLVGDGPANAGGLVVVVDGYNLIGGVQRGRVIFLCTGN